MIRIVGHVLKAGKLVAAKKSKYRAKRCTLDGYKFDSQQERDRYATLRHQEQMGAISELRVHPLFDLTAHGRKLGSYEADFSYRVMGNNVGARSLVVEDVKAIETPIFKWKRKHFEAEYPHCEFRLYDVKDGKMKRWTEEDLAALEQRRTAAGQIS